MPIIEKSKEGVEPSAGDAAPTNFRYYSEAGVPFYGDSPQLMTPAEYDASVVPMGFAGYGLFDVKQPQQTHFGRTLPAILERVRLGEFEIMTMTEYNNGVVADDPAQPPALFVFVMWIEKADTTPGNLRSYVQQN